MTPPLRQFLIISIVGVTLTVVSLFYLHLELTREYVAEHLDSHNKNLAIVLRNSILSEGLQQELMDGRNSLTDATYQQLNAALGNELRWIPIVKVKVYSRDGIVLYSSKSEEVGEDATDNEAFQGAITGTFVSGQVEPDHLNEFDNVYEVQDLHQQYIPIESEQTGEIIGVFETYLNIQEVVRGVRASQEAMLWLIGVVLLLTYVALALTFLRTHKLLRRESERRQASMDELRVMHEQLEQRVEERTSELDRARSFLQSVIDGIASPLLVIRPDFTIALMNESARRLMPAKREASSYRYCYQVAHELNAPCCKPDHPCTFGEVRERGSAVQVRHTHYDAELNPVIVDMVTTPLYSPDGAFEGVIEVQHDVTELVRMQEELIKSKAHLTAIMDHVPDAIITCDSNYVIESSNRSAQKLFHGSETDLRGRELTGFFVDPDSAKLLSSGSSVQQETVLKDLHGGEFPSDLWIGPLGHENGSARFIVVIRDVTSRIRAQREIETTRQQYFHQEKVAAIGQLAAGILHEVGNPIAAIAGAAAEVKHAFENDIGGDYVNRNLELINDQITRLGKITREIADFASPKPREREMLDLNGLLRGTARLLTYDRRFSSIGVDLQLDRDLPAVVGVADQLTQVFMNLLINAMDACVPLQREGASIILQSEFDGDRVHVCVEDFGTGMSPETLEHVTESFYTTKPVGKGTGLGLSLCDTIVSAHGGELRIESEEGRGTRVHVFLPLELEQDRGGDAVEEKRAI